MKKYIALLLVFMATGSYAQQLVTGTVFDTEGERVIGASVTWKNSTIGTTTDIDGKFNVTTGMRQPGSSIKPINYLLAFLILTVKDKLLAIRLLVQETLREQLLAIKLKQ